MAKSFKDYEQEGWDKKASQYERVTLPLTRQGFDAVDFSKAMVAEAKARFSEIGFTEGDGRRSLMTMLALTPWLAASGCSICPIQRRECVKLIVF